MIGLLKEYYGLEIDYSREYQDGLIFFVNGDYYYLCRSYLNTEDTDKSYELYLLLKNKNLLLHDFVFNKDNNILSDGYVLLKLNYLIGDIDLSDIKRTNIKIDFDMKDNFYKLWIDKIDYYEEKLFIDKSDYFVNYSFDYFIGISELLLDVYKANEDYVEQNYIVHRTFYSLSTIDYYNPLNIVIGDRFKDYSSYIRLTNNWDLLNEIVNKVNYAEKVNLFVRLAFPFRYFYYINDVFYGKYDRKEILNIVNEVDKYERYLVRLEEFVAINVFYWIKKDN